MAPVPVTEDYYEVLKVGQKATAEQIKSSYKRLAFDRHPDRNANVGSTQAFQLLGQAYETLKDDTTRRQYDLIYPSITQNLKDAHNTQATASASQSAAIREAAQVVALQKTKDERRARWTTRRQTFESSIFELQRSIRRLEQEVKNLASIAAAEAAAEAQKNSWGTWFLSPLYKKVEESEDEKARKDRDRQERKIQKDMKERRLESLQFQLREGERLLKQAKQEFDTDDLRDDQTIAAIETRARAREARERQEKERVERERHARIWEQQRQEREKEAQEAREIMRKHQAKARAEELARKEELRRQQDAAADELRGRYTNNTRSTYSHGSTSWTNTSNCNHGGWWEKVHGRTPCPECYVVYNYLLQCPGCSKRACATCKRKLGLRYSGNTATKRAPRRSESPPPSDWANDYYDYY